MTLPRPVSSTVTPSSPSGRCWKDPARRSDVTAGVAEARELVERRAAEEAGVGDTIRGNFPGGERFREAWTARALYELVEQLTTAEVRANVHPRELSANGKQGLTEFMLDLPTFSTYWELRLLRHRERRSWSGNDMRDLQSLVPAIVHCDVA